MPVATLLTIGVLVFAAAIGAWAVLTRSPSVDWKDFLHATGFAVVPALIIAGIVGGVSRTAIAVLLGIAAGHAITLLDDD